MTCVFKTQKSFLVIYIKARSYVDLILSWFSFFQVHELCLGINELSSHPHNLLWLVQLVPNWTSRGRY